MNPHPYSDRHTVYLVDLEIPLNDMLMVLADHCDDERMYSPQDVLMLSLHLLSTSHDIKGAKEAMEIDVASFCGINQTPYTKQRISEAIEHYLRTMQDVFFAHGFYSPEGFLMYTFGGWHDEYTPVFIPYSHIQQWPKALSAIVGGEPLDPHPAKVFSYPFTETTDKYLPF